MNAQLEILVEQATTYIEPTPNSGEGWVFDKEKFAELIVKECLGIVEECHEKAVDWGWDTDYAMCHTRYDIEKHFGVKIPDVITALEKHLGFEE